MFSIYENIYNVHYIMCIMPIFSTSLNIFELILIYKVK